jgi:glycosyltransferase involved in cell wall biosynthesis
MTQSPIPDHPLVTFALFAYNQEKYIREAVEGAFSQTYEPLEIILSDDCSSDRTFEIMQEMTAAYDGPHKVRVRRNDVNCGFAGHINLVIKLANAHIITWAAGDDIAIKDRTSTLVAPMINDKNIFGVHSAIIEITESGEMLEERHHNDRVKNIQLDDVCRNGTSVVTQSHAFRRDVFDHFGPLMSDLTNEGPVMAFRESSLGNVEYIDKPLTYYRVGSGVSTYSGDDALIIKEVEPLKISNWRRTSFSQIKADSQVGVIKLNSDNEAMVEKKFQIFSNLFLINSKKYIISSFIRNMFLNPFHIPTIKAALRVMSPLWIYSKFLQTKNK